MSDPHQLQRFVDAQDQSGTYETAMSELRAGRKTSHWMWFVFPQIAGLGSSPMAQRYAIASAEEAHAYLEHPVLGPRLIAAARVLDEQPGASAEAILGGIDAIKLRSSMTLFDAVADDRAPFRAALDRFFGGEADPATLALLNPSSPRA